MNWTAANIPNQSGRRAIVTGGNSGTGFFCSLELARAGAEVVIATRNQSRGQAAVEKIRAQIPSAKISSEILDLGSLASVRAFAARELAANQPIHILLNNAGIMNVPKRELSPDGYESQFATNVLGHFALTGLLLPTLTRSGTAANPGRIVTVSSIAHKRGKMYFDDLQLEHNYAPMRAYQQSKLGDLIFAIELDRRLRAAQLPVLSIAAHPGIADTNLFKRADYHPIELAARKIIGPIIGMFLNNAAQGALPLLIAAIDPHAQPGAYYGPNQLFESRGYPTAVHPTPAATDESSGARLWSIAEQLTGVNFLSSPAR
jgi:NAD(P)-dependent dehydrogenase (short-subunit alcohol dehydrogenase family)